MLNSYVLTSTNIKSSFWCKLWWYQIDDNSFEEISGTDFKTKSSERYPKGHGARYIFKCIEEVVTKKMNAVKKCDLAAHVGDDPVNESLDPGPNCGPKLSAAAFAPADQAYHLPPLAESSVSPLPNYRRPRVTLQDMAM